MHIFYKISLHLGVCDLKSLNSIKLAHFLFACLFVTTKLLLFVRVYDCKNIVTVFRVCVCVCVAFLPHVLID